VQRGGDALNATASGRINGAAPVSFPPTMCVCLRLLEQGIPAAALCLPVLACCALLNRNYFPAWVCWLASGGSCGFVEHWSFKSFGDVLRITHNTKGPWVCTYISRTGASPADCRLQCCVCRTGFNHRLAAECRCGADSLR
jgi:hypothetical protein